MKLPLSLLALAGALSGAPALAADAAVAAKSTKTATGERGDAAKPRAGAEAPRKEAAKAEAPGKAPPLEVPVKVVLVAD